MTSGLVIQNSARFSYNNPRLSFAFEGDRLSILCKDVFLILLSLNISSILIFATHASGTQT